MNRIYFVRHGEGQDNVARKFSSTWRDHSLTERGRLQALQTGEHLARKRIDGIFCSPMKRTHETAQIIAGRLDLVPVVLEELREINVGDLEGREFSDELWGIYHEVTSQWYAGNSQASFPGGEEYVSVWKRTRSAYQKIIQNHENRTFVVVGHGGIFVSTLMAFCPGLEVDWLQNVAYFNCAITELTVERVNEELRGRIIDWANDRHMSGEALSTLAAIPSLSALTGK